MVHLCVLVTNDISKGRLIRNTGLEYEGSYESRTVCGCISCGMAQDSIRYKYKRVRLSNGKCMSLQVSVEEQVNLTVEILFEVCIKALPTNTRRYMCVCLISLLVLVLLVTTFSLMDMFIGDPSS